MESSVSWLTRWSNDYSAEPNVKPCIILKERILQSLRREPVELGDVSCDQQGGQPACLK